MVKTPPMSRKPFEVVALVMLNPVTSPELLMSVAWELTSPANEIAVNVPGTQVKG